MQRKKPRLVSWFFSYRRNELQFKNGGIVMKIVQKKVVELIPYEDNPRNNKDAVQYVVNSIKEFGFKVPLVIDKDDVIVAGHTRWLASREIGIEEVPCIIADDLTDEQVKAFRLADNKVSEAAGWDWIKLDKELEELNLDMTKFNFTVPDIDGIEDFFETLEGQTQEKKEKTITCPHCGQEIKL